MNKNIVNKTAGDRSDPVDGMSRLRYLRHDECEPQAHLDLAEERAVLGFHRDGFGRI